MTFTGKAHHLSTCVKALLFARSTSSVKAHLFTTVKALLFTLRHKSKTNSNNKGIRPKRKGKSTNSVTLQIKTIRRFQVPPRAQRMLSHLIAT